MKCIVCNGQGTTLLRKNFPGYVEGTELSIHACSHCRSHFVALKDTTAQLYELIYRKSDLLGYDRYFSYATRVKKSTKPLQFLAFREVTYYSVLKYLSGKPKLKIIEVGCGYGYLTYALNQEGHQCFGIDVSESAIQLAAITSSIAIRRSPSLSVILTRIG